MRLRAVFLVATLVAVAAAPACGRHKRAQSAVGGDSTMAYGLGDADADNRKDAAEKLREDGGPPPAAVPQLIKAVSRETDPDAKEEMLITLGASGSPDARPVLEQSLNDPEKGVRKGAEKGLDLWGKKTGQAVNPAVARIARLQNQDWEVRRDAAEDLYKHGTPLPEAIPPLVTAAGKETHPKALNAMMRALGESGAPEGKPVIEAHLADQDSDTRRGAAKAMKIWRIKNGQQVRRDVETKPPPAPVAATTTAAPASEPPPPDGCQQFKEICAADPFDLDKCRGDMKPLSYDQQVAWADCVNASSEKCQKAHTTCMSKAKVGGK